MSSRTRSVLLAIVGLSLCALSVVWFLGDGALTGYSNVLAADYVGPEACRDCHLQKYDLWEKHAHSVMNQNPSPETVLGDFSYRRLDYAGGSAVFETKGSDYFMTLRQNGALVRRYRVTRTVGSIYIQFYVGVQVAGPEPMGSDPYRIEHKLPFGYLLKRKQWLPQTYFDPSGPEYLEDGTLATNPYHPTSMVTWGGNCLLCHNTYPYAIRLLFGGNATGFPREDLRGIDGLIEQAKRDVGPSYLTQPAKNLVTMGISCESCHFGGREHVENSRPMAFAPTHPSLEIQPHGLYTNLVPDKNDPYVISGICGQCHESIVTKFPNGSSTWNSSEVSDLSVGACISEIRCTHCHNPHKSAAPREAFPANPEHIRACVRCHESYQDSDFARKHTKHSNAAEVSCLDCHMPAYSMGLERIVRSHTISSPTDSRMYNAAAPNACGLCHLDKSIAWILNSLKEQWGVEIERSPDMKHAYGGSLEKPVGLAWLGGEDSDMRKVASQSYGRSPLGEQALAELLRALDDEVQSNRLFTLMAVEQILDRQIPEDQYSLTAVSEVRQQQIGALLASLRNEGVVHD